MTSIEQVATFGTMWVVLTVSHNLADHIFGQTDHQAAGRIHHQPRQRRRGARNHGPHPRQPYPSVNQISMK
ncbi:hypothetical protein [Streptomyces sp. NPDC051173]|uniref:hypothetical protein n=1 Tax=Streptomyces sp. NPDC051173 TaxID=3155164 RepID=UPI00344B6E96